jgi:hypothetical protein
MIGRYKIKTTTGLLDETDTHAIKVLTVTLQLKIYVFEGDNVDSEQ